MKQQYIELKTRLRANAEDLVAYFKETQESLGLSMLLLAMSSLLVCIGLNFNNTLIVYAGLFLSPFIFYIFQFTIGIYCRDNSLSLNSFIKIILGYFLTFIIGLIYFKITPFAFNLSSIQSTCSLSLPILLSVLFIGLTIDLFNRHRVPIVIWILKLTINWSVMIVGISIAVIQGNGEWIIELVFNCKLLFIFFFIGLTAMIWSFGLSKNDTTDNKFKLVYPIATFIFFVFGIYFGINEMMRLTTQYNTEQYFESGFESKNFYIHNFVIEKSTKQIKVYYSGIKPAIIQDESLKKKYNLSGYHFEYIDLKQ